MTHIFWPLDLTVNSWAKNFMKEKYAVWYASQITVGLEKGLAIDEIGPEGLQLYKKRGSKDIFFYMCDFLFCMETQNTIHTTEQMWLFIEMEKEEKKTSRICNVLFSMEICKAIQKIDSYTFKLKTIFFFAKLQTKVQKPM